MLQTTQKLRICNICGARSDQVVFYHRVTSRCAECHKIAVRRNRAEKIDYYRQYDVKRFQEQPARRAANDAYAKTPAGKSVMERSRKKWMAVNKEKRQAHISVGNALRDGKLTKPEACTMCGNKARRIHGHHTDYSKPLEVIWVCPPCHTGLHK